MKKTISILVLLVIMFSMMIPAYAADTTSTKISEATKMADELKSLGLFLGTGTGYELERAGTRPEAFTMLIRLLGEENTAKASTYANPFADVPEWATKYVAYGYNKGYTKGISATEFGTNENTTAAHYITFVLRALGYNETVDGYTWDNPFAFAQTLGLIKAGEYSADSAFIRADIVIISYRALDIKYKNQNITLREKLFGSGNTTTNPWEGDPTQAGKIRTDVSKLITVNKSVSYDVNLVNLNTMLMNTYGLTYTPNMTKTGQDNLGIKLLNDSSNRYGLKISSWRHSYDSNVAVNNMLNAVLETLYFECGDKQVAYALWSWIDSMSINGKGNTNDFGFTDVSSSGNTGVIKMNGIEIEATMGSDYVTVYFN